MILRLLFLTCVFYVSPTFCRMTAQEFEDTIHDMCFKDKDSLLNGQENPLPNTLENFISLAEKFESVNPNLEFKEELYYFLRHYVYENIELTKSGVSQWTPPNADLYEINRMWEPESSSMDRLTVVDPFIEAEKCSLYFMISHSIVDKPIELSEWRSYGNTSNNVLRNTFDPDSFYPRENGVVSIRGTDAAVSLSRVLYGMYVGLRPDRDVEILSYRNVNQRFPNIQPGTRIDKLYTLTLAEVLALASWSLSPRNGLAPNGQWKSISLDDNSDITDFCPLVYMQSPSNGKKALSVYSYSSVRGAVDGLILGSVMPQIIQQKSKARLSQILRMYYSRDGVPVEQGSIDLVTAPRASFCNRNDFVDPLEKEIYEQTENYYYLVVESLGVKNVSFENAKRMYVEYKRDTHEISNSELRTYCSEIPSLDKPENLPRETFLDVIVVMDSSSSQDLFWKQQKITGLLAKRLDMRYTGTRMTILLDQRITTDSSNSVKIELKPIVVDTYSSGCAACTVAQIAYERSQMDEDQVIQAIDQLLQDKKENETAFNGVNGKVVVYFNFENDDMQRRDNSKIQGRLQKALRDLHLHHQEVLMFAVGLNEELLKRFTKNDRALVASAGISEEEIAKNLYDRISNAPGQLQYPDCERARSEGSAIYENFVSPNVVQHWEVPPQYFYKSTDLKVSFETKNGAVKVCHNRATMKPELEAKNCNTTSTSNRIEFRIPNPCMGFNEITCSPFYFAVMGMTPADTNGNNRPRTFCEDTKDNWCSTLNQVKFTVTHQGMRCSGSISLRSLPAIILFTVLLAYILHKRF